MKKVELLSPVGNQEMLYQAIHNGADAIYLAGTNYGARKFATNFTREEIKEAIQYAHLYGVLVYVTVNILIHESEIDDVLEYLDFLHKNGVDAVIMQDIGLMQLVRRIYPNLEIHASTQAHNHNQETLSLYHKLGIKRVVLARELSLEEIKKFDVEIEKEVFVYGALCVCYSGCCLFSSLNGGRSGNRGECVGSCRLPYKLIKNDQIVQTKGSFLLSTKELNTLEQIKELLASGIDCFKIEGRMKSPAYVGYVTRLYRTLIDNYYQNVEPIITSHELINLKKLFNREFTKGYLFNEEDIMNIKTPNHQGIEIGYVISSNKHKLKIKLTKDALYQNDGIRFEQKDVGMIINRLYDDKGLLVNSVPKGNICFLDNKFHIGEGEHILKTIDSNLNQELVNISPKKIPITMFVKCMLNTPLEVTISDGIYKKTIIGNSIESARSQEVGQEQIIKQLSKLGNTPFTLDKIELQKDKNIFIPLINLNQIKREAVEQLINERIKPKIPYQKNFLKESSYPLEKNKTISINALVRNEEQLKACLEENLSYIYVTDYQLYQEYKHYDNIYYRLSRIMKEFPDYQNEKLLVGEIGSINHYHKNNTLIGDYYLNITNHHSIQFLRDYNVRRVTLSVELVDEEIQKIMEYFYPVELIIYGRLEVMIMKYCPLKKNLNYCTKCTKGKKEQFYLEDKWKHRYPIIKENCLTHILHYKPIDKINKIETYRKMGLYQYRIELWNETYAETKACIRRIKEKCQ